jgi:hypothetical protein
MAFGRHVEWSIGSASLQIRILKLRQTLLNAVAERLEQLQYPSIHYSSNGCLWRLGS